MIQIRLYPFAKSFFGLGLGSIAAAATFLLLSEVPTGGLPSHFFGNILPGANLIFMFAVPCGFLAHAILYTLKWRWIPVYCLAAAVEAALYGIIGGVGIDVARTAMPAAAVCAAIAWLIRRPDKDATP
jgi:hypothetical protein